MTRRWNDERHLERRGASARRYASFGRSACPYLADPGIIGAHRSPVPRSCRPRVDRGRRSAIAGRAGNKVERLASARLRLAPNVDIISERTSDRESV